MRVKSFYVDHNNKRAMMVLLRMYGPGKVKFVDSQEKMLDPNHKQWPIIHQAITWLENLRR